VIKEPLSFIIFSLHTLTNNPNKHESFHNIFHKRPHIIVNGISPKFVVSWPCVSYRLLVPSNGDCETVA